MMDVLNEKIIEEDGDPEWEGSVLGSPLIFDLTKVGYKYANIWGVDVKDIPKYADYGLFVLFALYFLPTIQSIL